MKPVVATPALLLLLLTACQHSGAVTTANKDVGQKASAAPTSAALKQGSGTSKKDPCSLLTKGMAEGALGLAVGPATTSRLPGSVTCFYKPADGRANVFVLLTTYAASGKAALATVTTAFPDARSVAGIGDAALVSRRGHAIGVSVGDLLFAVSLLRPDGLSVPPTVSEAQLITLARTVVRSR
jgi:hypothetical protein